ncbi:hypothetical protein [Marinobacter zhejiangensis]|uniref:Uncharacterized protein n=1 Tax=Marinobacter zhejiangensis TaxID=488535 RepID=A0A1I4PCR3_9GAMM|nr:hypothetical protein [Marinobacter zhejiangensis]SFM25562.1 hypothetical protein SAMN04487963_1942 [Marinobacter zhejiangensis]
MDGIKSQDLGLLLKLVSLQKREAQGQADNGQKAWPYDWQDWGGEGDESLEWQIRDDFSDEFFPATVYTVRSLESETGIGKSQVSNSLRRCLDVGLAKKDRKSGVPRVNAKRLYEFIVYGAKYVFPAKPGPLVRGIGTSFAAPVLEHRLFSAGEWLPVWPDARGNNKGLEISPLFKTVGHAVRRDPELYALLALVDAIRIGGSREANLAKDLLEKHMDVSE